MASKRETSQQNGNPATEPTLTPVPENGDLQGVNSQRNGDPQELSSQLEELAHEAIAERTYQLWYVNGCRSGFHEADWSQAEQELRARREPSQAKSISVSASNS